MCKFENRRFSFNNLAEPQHIRNLSLFGSGSARLGDRSLINHHKLIQIKQKFPSYAIDNRTERIKSEIAGLRLHTLIKPGDSIAITAGSRGISDINLITRNVIDEVIKL